MSAPTAKPGKVEMGFRLLATGWILVTCAGHLHDKVAVAIDMACDLVSKQSAPKAALLLDRLHDDRFRGGRYFSKLPPLP